MSDRISAGEDGLHREHDNTGFNKASGQNQRGALGSSQGIQPICGFLLAFPSHYGEKKISKSEIWHVIRKQQITSVCVIFKGCWTGRQNMDRLAKLKKLFVCFQISTLLLQ